MNFIFCFRMFQGIIVNELKEITQDPATYLERFEKRKDPWYPQTYETCAQFFHMLFGVVFYGLPLESRLQLILAYT